MWKKKVGKPLFSPDILKKMHVEETSGEVERGGKKMLVIFPISKKKSVFFWETAFVGKISGGERREKCVSVRLL